MAMNYAQLLEYELLGNSGNDYARFVVISIIAFLALKIFKTVIIARMKKTAAKTKTDIDDLIVNVVEKVHWPFYVFVALYFSLRALHLSSMISRFVGHAVLVAAAYYIIQAMGQVVAYLAERVIAKRQKEEKTADAAAVYLLSKTANMVLWIIGGLFVLSNFGINISSMIAGLGIGGIAIALALQNVLTDVFSSFSIYFDRPFQIGDFIIIGEHMGVVKNIGIKSTRIQALQGEEIVISNRELTSTRVQNFKRMERRRIAFMFGIIYQTPLKKLGKIQDIVRDIIRKEELADIDRVHFKKFGDSSLDFEVVYYLKTGDYNKYMDTQHSINMQLVERFEGEGIEFAYPTRTIYMQKA